MNDFFSTNVTTRFKRSGEDWTLETKLIPDDVMEGDQFGFRIALDQIPPTARMARFHVGERRTNQSICDGDD